MDGFDGGSTGSCPKCGTTFDDEGLVAGSHFCDGCGTLFKSVGGELLDVRDLREGAAGGECAMCQSSLARGVSYLPYENGSNSHAYIACPSCGHENVRYGLGEDD